MNKFSFPSLPVWRLIGKGRYKGAKFVEALPEHERGLIEDLKPYQGVNPALWALRQLDIVRNHRRLLSVYVNPRSVSIRGSAGFGFKPVPFIAPVDDKTVLGFIPRRPSKPDINVACHISFDEALLGIRKPVIPTLHELARFAASIIELF